MLLLAATLSLASSSNPDACNQAYKSELMSDSYTGEEKVSDGEVDLESGDLEFMFDGSDQQIIGVQIAGLQVAKGARIRAAQLIFEVEDDDANTGPLTVEIRAEASGTTAFLKAEDFDVSHRQTTNSFVHWDPPNDSNRDDDYGIYTTDLSQIVQEVVDRHDWDMYPPRSSHPGLATCCLAHADATC